VNSAGASALSVSGGGRWLVWSQNPSTDTRGGLVYGFKQYNAVNGTTPIAQATGNGFLYTLAPTLATTLTGGVSKVYDGTTTATLAASHYSAPSGLVDGDTATVASSGTATFDTKNVGTSKTVASAAPTYNVVNGLAAVYGYGASAPATKAMGTITAKAITVDATGVNKVYDGTTVGAATLASTGVVAGDAVTFNGNGSFADKNVGVAKAVSVSGILAAGTDAANYSLSNTTAISTADITQAALSAALSGLLTKVYDGNSSAILGSSNYALTGFVSGEGASVTQTAGVYNSKNVASANTVSAALGAGSFVAAGATQLSNYSLPTTASGAASITTLGITVEAAGANKVYDGSTVNAVTLTSAGVLSGDAVTFNGNGGFADKNVGIGKAVSVSGISASGIDADNYSLTTSTATTTANITPANLIYQAAAAQSIAGQVPSGFSGTVIGLVGGDTLAAATTGKLAWTSPATAKSAAGSYSIDGTGLAAVNYLFAQASGNATALTIQAGNPAGPVVPVFAVNSVAGLLASAGPFFHSAHPLLDDPGLPGLTALQIIRGGVHMPPSYCAGQNCNR
ncbi:MAG: YDG domain-containing protein, partial [Paralcaligenes sp.]